MSLYLKDADSSIDHGIDWSAHLAGQSIAASLWSVAPVEAGGLSVEASAIEGLRTSVRVSGGLIGRLYRLTNRVTLSDGQVDARSVTFRVEEC
ncbi:phage fiber-tail adaptor protein [Sphingobium xenophagum]|uniref:Uncharacterized protein n=1 Tax=Sphingobium xenophagum TaxID=121428 RepID=A0A401J1C1_SPHXE|nr:hypothetical protein [Sphingobium xenophagum]GBH30431.1 hypothetical protein MBESOW_P1685 [Sphingobium xenophagum]